MMNPSPPELFADPPVRSDFQRGLSYRTRRIITVSVLLTVAAVGLYFIFGRGPHTPGEIPVIKAEGPYKQKPQQPGGIDIPHQDVEVYQAIDGKGGVSAAIEHLLPMAETPKPISPIITAQGTSPAPATTQNPSNTAPVIATTVTPQAQPVPKAAATVPVQASPKPVSQVVAPASSPPVSVPIKTGPVVQLASVTDATAAQAMAQKLEVQYASYLNGVPLRVVKADLGARGVFYRIQSKPVSSAVASQICTALKNHNAGCIVVRR